MTVWQTEGVAAEGMQGPQHDDAAVELVTKEGHRLEFSLGLV
ncbi:hypothetical protein [Delftia sp.]|nr:hypothetical protein [Delftia sp.]